MKCDFCGAPTKVTGMTNVKDGTVNRRRTCVNGHVFHTREHSYTPQRATRDNASLTKEPHHGHPPVDPNPPAQS